MYLFLLCIFFLFLLLFFNFNFLLLFNYSCVPFLVAVYFLSKPLTFLTPLLSLKFKVMVNMRGDPSAPAGVAVRGCVPASVNFAADSFTLFVHFMMGDSQCICPHRAVRSVVYEQKMAWPCAPPSLLTQSHPEPHCLPRRKSPQRGTLCRCGRGDTKNSRTKRHQNWWVQKLFWAVEKSLDGCISSNGEYSEGDWSLNMWEYTVFVSKFHGVWVPLQTYVCW